MDNKKYLDKVVGSILRGTKIDYGTRRVYTPFSLPLLPFTFTYFLHIHTLSIPFTKYCVNHFGLTEEEIEYVWEKYKDIILEKINQ